MQFANSFHINVLPCARSVCKLALLAGGRQKTKGLFNIRLSDSVPKMEHALPTLLDKIPEFWFHRVAPNLGRHDVAEGLSSETVRNLFRVRVDGMSIMRQVLTHVYMRVVHVFTLFAMIWLFAPSRKQVCHRGKYFLPFQTTA